MASIFANSPDLPSRLAIGLTIFPLIIALSFLGPNWSLALLTLIAAFLGSREMARMVAPEAPPLATFASHFAVIATLTAIYIAPESYVIFGAGAAALIGISISLLASLKTTEGAHISLSGLIFSWLYCSVAFTSLAMLARPLGPGTDLASGALTSAAAEQGFWFLLPMFAVWASDTGAYFTGKAIGKRKLSPLISPGKSWEGAFGGTVASIGATYLLLSLAAPDSLPDAWWLGLAIAIPAAILGVLGDLAESLIKRSTNTKDSGKLLAGHGGMLDRVDGMLFAAPWCLLIKLLVL